MVGGALGLDARFGTTGAHTWFFHLDAGILGEVTPSAAARINDHIMGIGSLGIGGRVPGSGTGFIWRVGGFAIVSDRASSGSGAPVMGGGAAGTIGVGF
jgi:hypothetical protein